MLSWKDINLIHEIKKDGESTQSYVAGRILANTCEYGTMKDEFIRDKIVSDITSDRV